MIVKVEPATEPKPFVDRSLAESSIPSLRNPRIPPYIQELLQEPAIQRLQGVGQMCTSALTSHGKTLTHTRFEHSLGAALAAQAWLEENRLDSNPKRNAELSRALIVAALFHDIAHASGSHALEDLFKDVGGFDHDHAIRGTILASVPVPAEHKEFVWDRFLVQRKSLQETVGELRALLERSQRPDSVPEQDWRKLPPAKDCSPQQLRSQIEDCIANRSGLGNAVPQSVISEYQHLVRKFAAESKALRDFRKLSYGATRSFDDALGEIRAYRRAHGILGVFNRHGITLSDVMSFLDKSGLRPPLVPKIFDRGDYLARDIAAHDKILPDVKRLARHVSDELLKHTRVIDGIITIPEEKKHYLTLTSVLRSVIFATGGRAPATLYVNSILERRAMTQMRSNMLDLIEEQLAAQDSLRNDPDAMVTGGNRNTATQVDPRIARLALQGRRDPLLTKASQLSPAAQANVAKRFQHNLSESLRCFTDDQLFNLVGDETDRLLLGGRINRQLAKGTAQDINVEAKVALVVPFSDLTLAGRTTLRSKQFAQSISDSLKVALGIDAGACSVIVSDDYEKSVDLHLRGPDGSIVTRERFAGYYKLPDDYKVLVVALSSSLSSEKLTQAARTIWPAIKDQCEPSSVKKLEGQLNAPPETYLKEIADLPRVFTTITDAERKRIAGVSRRIIAEGATEELVAKFCQLVFPQPKRRRS